MFDFNWPMVFLLLPLPWLLRRILPAERRSQAALQISFLDRLQRIASTPNQRRSRTPMPGLAVGVWLLLVVAAARPEWLGEPIALPTSGRDLMLAVDLSGSMDYRDMQIDGEQATRITVIKEFLDDFIASRHGDRIGLILFGSNAYVQAPLTLDREAIRGWLDEAFIGLAGRETAIGDAIGLAIKRLIERPAGNRVVLLITDGANTAGRLAPLQAARLAAERQIRIFTIGIGADPTDAAGNDGLLGAVDPSLDLDEGMLKDIAQLTGARYFRVREVGELADIHAALNALEPALHEGTPIRAATALYPWPLALALLLSLAGAAWHGRRHAS